MNARFIFFTSIGLSLCVAASPAGAGDPPITSLAFAPDGKSIAACSQAGLRIYSWPGLKPGKKLETNALNLHDLAFSPGGDRLAVGGGIPADEGTVEIFSWPAGKPLFVRISSTDWTDGGWSGDDSVALAQRLADVGVDLVDASTGGNVLADIPVGPGYQVPFASQIRDKASVATAAVGMITDAEQAETILGTGQADAVFLARAALRDPAWPLRAAHTLGLDHHEAPYRPQYLRGAWRD